MNADRGAVKDYFWDGDLSLIHQLVELYENTKRCSIAYRYWCTFYNIMAKNLVQFPTLAESGILELLQR